jgi:protein-S-isoprenylcysteine O-methyltransferase Ste14
MKSSDLIAQDAWFRFVGDYRGGFSLLAVALVIYRMLAGRDLPADILEPHPSSLAITGTGLLVAGGLLRLRAAGYIRKNQEVTHAGPYSLVRHPLYLGTLLAWLGFLLLSGDVLLGLQTFWLLVFAVYYPKMVLEEWRLTQRFGAAYMAYQQEVPMMVPRQGLHYQPGQWTLSQAWQHKGFRLLALIPLILLALEAIEELRQGHFIFASLQQLIMREPPDR